MDLNEAKLREILLKENYISDEDLKKSVEYAAKQHTSLVDFLLSKNLTTKALLGQAIAEAYNISYVNLEVNQPTKDLVLKVSEDVARKYRLVLYEVKDKDLFFATDSPGPELTKYLSDSHPGYQAKVAYTLPEGIDGVLSMYKKSLATRFSKIVTEKQQVAPEIITEIFKDALTMLASDIHFEPQAKEVVVRFRIDGVLQEAGRLKKEYYENILNRIKVQAHLRIDEHFSAQDGSMRYEDEGKVVDMRVSIVPIIDGEKIVIRILAQYISGYNLSDLGLSDEDQKILAQNSRKPFGMIIVSGPTGSGKTTTLYAVLKNANRPEVNVMTIEDPIEYRILGINQIQVNLQTNLTFTKGLRSIVRQDPDIILVGEIRDQETAEIAVNAALTGHLLFSTFHANDASTVIPRLLDMKVEPFLLSSTLELIIAQRLVRKLCEKCRYSAVLTSEMLQKFGPTVANYFKADKEDHTIYASKGCDACNNTGYKGRSAIFEIISVTPEIREMILKNSSSQQIWQVAQKQGSKSMFDDGISKVKNGTTTIEELIRVASPPEA